MDEGEAIFLWVNPFPLIGDIKTFCDDVNWKDLVDDKFYRDYINCTDEFSSNTRELNYYNYGNDKTAADSVSYKAFRSIGG